MTILELFEKRKKEIFQHKMEKLESERVKRYLERVEIVTGKEWNPYDALMGNYNHIANI